MGVLLLIVGLLVMAVGGILLLVKAFQENVLWGLGCIFVPCVSLIFVVMHWQEAKNAFFMQLAGVVLVILAVVMSPSPPTSTGVVPSTNSELPGTNGEVPSTNGEVPAPE